jgi:hypothetical protein
MRSRVLPAIRGPAQQPHKMPSCLAQVFLQHMKYGSRTFSLCSPYKYKDILKQSTRQRSRYSDWLRGRSSSPGRGKNCSILHVVETGTGAHPASYPMGAGTLSPGVKRPGRESDHSPPTTTELKRNSDPYIRSPISLHGAALN